MDGLYALEHSFTQSCYIYIYIYIYTLTNWYMAHSYVYIPVWHRHYKGAKQFSPEINSLWGPIPYWMSNSTVLWHIWTHDEVTKWRCFIYYCPFVGEILMQPGLFGNISAWGPWKQGSWSQHGAHLGLKGTRWAPWMLLSGVLPPLCLDLILEAPSRLHLTLQGTSCLTHWGRDKMATI